jgi:hypothetical protein
MGAILQEAYGAEFISPLTQKFKAHIFQQPHDEIVFL